MTKHILKKDSIEKELLNKVKGVQSLEDLRDKKIPFLSGRPEREVVVPGDTAVINEDDIANLKIALETEMYFELFLLRV